MRKWDQVLNFEMILKCLAVCNNDVVSEFCEICNACPKDEKQIKTLTKNFTEYQILLIYVKFDFVLLIKTFIDVVAPKGAVLCGS